VTAQSSLEHPTAAMPFNELLRRDSWPPTIVRINDEDAAEANPIDEDPFSYFLTSPDELDEEEDLSAGIESATKPTQVREVSPSSLQHSPLPFEDDDDDDDDDDDGDFGLAMPLTLRQFTFRHSSGDAREPRPTGLGISLPQLRSSRGRPTVRLSPSRSVRGRGQTRSLSARRPHSWRVPSPDLGSITEEKECEEEGAREIEGQTKTGLSVSGPTPAEVEKVKPSPKSKPKKRVHWAL
jgi:hypothetical protein